MKRLSLITLISIFCATVSLAQLRIAIVGGPHQSKVLEENDMPGWDDFKKNYTERKGGHFGFIADLPFSEKSNFSFQPGVIYYAKGRKFLQNFDTTVSETLSIRSSEYINYIDMPLNLVYKIRLGKTVKFIIGAGPYVSFFYNGKTKKETTSKLLEYTVEENDDLGVGNGPGKYTTLDYGVNGLAGFEFGRVFITANYSRGLKDFYQAVDYTGKFKHEVMGLTLGIFLGKPVKVAPKDKDGDGVLDKDDKCPDIAGLPQFQGCIDTDKDGIPDNEDACPGVAGPKVNKGCPYVDKDGDGILDKDDKCPDAAGPKENGGCPYLDSDKDGILDKDDKCPTQTGYGRYDGCPIPDTDGDGVNDEEDKCPAIKGLKERNGCPEEVKKEIVEKVNYAAKRIQFMVNSAELMTGSYKVLDDVVTVLKANPELRLVIEGHTSSEGLYDTNMKLSLNRANNVKAYLESKGIESSRLSAVGYGPDRPLNDGKTQAEKVKNRRVELKANNQ